MEKKFYEKVKYYEWPHPEDTASTLRWGEKRACKHHLFGSEVLDSKYYSDSSSDPDSVTISRIWYFSWLHLWLAKYILNNVKKPNFLDLNICVS
jgi:hypothetical protein